MLELFHPAVADWFRDSFESADAAAAPGLAGDRARRVDADPRADRQRQDADGVPLVHQPADVRRRRRAPARRCRVLYISPLKALAVDIERNLRAPLAGIANRAAARGDAHHVPAIAIRTGDTPAIERARFQREPADILITTPESLYLLLTSNAREALRSIDTVIIDEIHALVPTKRGAHLALSLERLERLRDAGRAPMQRIGLSATQRPLDEVARFLGGTLHRAAPASTPVRKAEASGRQTPTAAPIERDPDDAIHDEFAVRRGGAASYRPVTIVDTSREEAARADASKSRSRTWRGSARSRRSRAARRRRGRCARSIWTRDPSAAPRAGAGAPSTLIFVNSRRIAERLAAALNELAGEVARALAPRLAGAAAAHRDRGSAEGRPDPRPGRHLVARARHRHGRDRSRDPDRGAAVGRERHAAHRPRRAHHRRGQPRRHRPEVPRRPGRLRRGDARDARGADRVDPLSAQPARRPRAADRRDGRRWTTVDGRRALRRGPAGGAVRRARAGASFEGVLDMLSGRYPSDDFADLRPRLTWDRLERHADRARRARSASRSSTAARFPTAGSTACSWSASAARRARVGELDEEMVFESRVGETFLLGASTWRIEEITHDRVLVSPAPGEPGKMPFWKADAAGRPLELGRHIGELVRDAAAACRRPRRSSGWCSITISTSRRPRTCCATSPTRPPPPASCPTTARSSIERCRDELGDWRICVLSPFGGRIHAPWAMAVVERARAETGLDVETMWTDDGFVVRFPETDEPPDPALMLPASDEVEALVLRQLGGTALFAAKFREAAGRALLLPKRRPGGRSPLWQQRKRAADLLAVAAQFGSFPMLLEAYRECLRDVFDMPALVDTLRRIETPRDQPVDRRFDDAVAVRRRRCSSATSPTTSTTATRRSRSAAPRRCRSIRRSCASCSAKRSCASCSTPTRSPRSSASCSSSTTTHRARSSRRRPRSAAAPRRSDGRRARGAQPRRRRRGARRRWCEARRAIAVTIAGSARVHPGRVRGAVPRRARRAAAARPARVAARAGRPTPRTISRAATRARTGRSRPREFADALRPRPRDGRSAAEGARCRGTAARGRVPAGRHRAASGAIPTCCSRSAAARWPSCASKSSRSSRRSSAGCSRRWQGVVRRRAGLDALLDAIENLQGAPLPASIFETRDPRGARSSGYNPADLDALTAARRSRLVRRRAARRARRPPRALPDRPPARGCGGRRR